MKSKPEADARARALALLARREHTRAELARKLEAADFDASEVQPLLDEFEAKNWLSDRRFAESWVADHRAKSGCVKLAYELRQHGVPDAVIDEVLGSEEDGELERARVVWRKKFGTPPTDAAEKARQMRFLQSRGFSLSIAHRTITSSTEQIPHFTE
ncbi:MAG: recombination regulator RecX [Pseudomonadota bacterium]